MTAGQGRDREDGEERCSQSHRHKTGWRTVRSGPSRERNSRWLHMAWVTGWMAVTPILEEQGKMLI